ncbi:MAG: hypothetical protein J6Y75_09840 [Spirochaetaceae bacterium]|nr:hypothetical protein [Spirochaetaceae bacterium]MBP5330182.1 hypothetical protein [Spirochaetaceae bacterium]
MNKPEKKPKMNLTKFQKTILAAGFISILAGILQIVISFGDFQFTFHYLRSLFIIIFGAIFLYLGLIVIQKSWTIFVGLLCILFGFLLFLIDSNILSFSLYQIWPFVVILSGLCLIPAGFYRYRRITTVFFVPSMVLIGMGFFFLLFSLDIIKISLREAAATWWPILFVLFGIGLIILFFYSQNTNNKTARQSNDFDEYEDIS